MTPRERGEALFRLLDRHRSLSDDEYVALIARAITEHVRVLLADDEATIEVLGEVLNKGWRLWRDEARAVLAALRRKACGSAGQE